MRLRRPFRGLLPVLIPVASNQPTRENSTMAIAATALTTEELLTQLSEGTARLASTDEWTTWLSGPRH